MAQRAVVIVGAGVFGSAAALALHRRGLGVRLVDPGPLPHPSASSTDIAKAVRMDYGDDAFYAELAAEALRGWDAWNADGRPPLFHRSGILFLSRQGLAHGGFEAASRRTLEARGVPLTSLDPAELARRFPAWAGAPYADGYFNPEAGWVESGAVVARLIEAARQAGVLIHSGQRVARLVDAGSRIVGVELEDGSVLSSELVLVAAGAWTPEIVPHLAHRMRANGQPVVHYRPSDPAPFAGVRFPVWCADIAGSGWYGFPVNSQGLVKIGHHGPGRPWKRGQPLEVEPEELRRNVEFVRRTLPGLAGAPVAGTRLCLYCDTPDGDFLIDHDPDHPGLIIAAGGSGHAFKFAPVIGELIADVVLGRANPAAGRFAWREPGGRHREQARHGG